MTRVAYKYNLVFVSNNNNKNKRKNEVIKAIVNITKTKTNDWKKEIFFPWYTNNTCYILIIIGKKLIDKTWILIVNIINGKTNVRIFFFLIIIFKGVPNII